MDSTWVCVAAGSTHCVALKADGTLWTWGHNSSGQLGDGTTTDNSTPTQIGTDQKWFSIAVADSFNLAIKADGTLWAWGNNTTGQLGNGTTTTTNTPIQIGTDRKWTNIAAGGGHSLAIKADGTLWSWGNNAAGQLGDGTTTNQSSPLQIGSERNWVGIAAGSTHSIGLKANGTLWTWGNNSNGQLGDGTTTNHSSPAQLGTEHIWVSAAAGTLFSFALKANGTLWACGQNTYGELGDATNADKNNPVQISTDDKWLSLAAGNFHSLGIKADGSLWAWGDNGYGQLGTTGIPHIPAQVGTNNNWISIAGQSYSTHSLGLKADGTLWAWGRNTFGEVGNGTTTNQYSPINIGNDSDWVAIAVGEQSSFGLKANGTLWAWGYNQDSQLGDGTTVNHFTPTKIITDSNFVCITASSTSAHALKSNGTIFSWGDATSGAIGNGNGAGTIFPIQTGIDSTWITVTGGAGTHIAGLKSNGTLWAWGTNGYNECGPNVMCTTGSFGAVCIPAIINFENNWVTVGAGYENTLGLKSNGTLWGMGWGNQGQLGDGLCTHNVSYLVHGPEVNWVTIAASSHTLGLKANGKFHCAAGMNTVGQLGDNTTVNKCSFVCVCVPPSVPTASPATITGCSGSAFTFNATGVGTLGWYSAASGGSYLGGGASFTSPVLNTSAYYYVQDSVNCTSATRAVVHVIVNPTPTATATLNMDTLRAANVSGAAYQWLDCANSFTPVAGATAKTFIPAISGNYAVAVTKTGCADTSVCNAVNINCLVHYNTTYDTAANNFIVTVDSVTAAQATGYLWNFGDGNTSTLPAPSHTYTVDTVYNVCLQIQTASSGNCSYCHLIGKDYLGHIIKAAGFTINVHNGSSGISTVANNEDRLTLYPNPTKELLVIELLGYLGNANTIQIYDVLGRECISPLSGGEGSGVRSSKRIELNVSKLTSGIYFLKLADEKGNVRMGKFVKE